MLSILWIVLIVIASLVFSNVYLSCVLYTLCCQFSYCDCLFVFSNVYSWPLFSILWIVLIVIASLVFSNVYWSCVLYTLCCQFSGLSLFWLPLWYSLTFIGPVSCIPYVVNSLDCPFIVLIASLVFSNVYLSCVLYTLCCQFSGLSLLWLPLWYSLTFIGPVSCIPYVVNSLDCPYFDCLFGIL